MEDYLAHVASSDQAKSRKYRKAWDSFLAGHREQVVYSVIAKTGEYFNSDPGEDISERSNRSRCIFDPKDIVKAFGGWYAQVLKRHLKKVNTEYAGEKNVSIREKMMTADIEKIPNPVFITDDGSSHDSNQNKFVMLIDQYIIAMTFTRLTAQFNFT